ncbi:hypothetical protein NLG97_g3705 [Lecanicillium saksenae]|uniref:Uncharacterized protein n=1 Tax=Lecanicillium saksenae TaxID=468837 RepID=A0ACC1R008_9HYPO|nr:hypothetical protein NLG97_g3705 [Lecanicillium saksenae]
MVNLTQLLSAAKSAKVYDRRIQGIFDDTKKILRAGTGIRGTFIPHHQVAEVCHCLNIEMAGLPDFLVGAGNNNNVPIKFFSWREKQIAYFQGTVNLNQIVLAAGRQTSVFRRKGVQKLLQNATQLSGDRTTAGTFIPHAKAISVCTQLRIKFDDLPEFIAKRSDPQFTGSFDFFEWHGHSVAHIPNHRLVNATQMFMAVGYSRQALSDPGFDSHFSKKYPKKGGSGTQGTYVLYGDAIRACEAKAIDTRQLLALLLEVERE